MAKHFKADDLVIEIDTPKGERYHFGPCGNDFGPQRYLRSRHDITKLTPGPRGHLGQIANMPPVPGQHVVLNVGTRTGRLVDPLNWEVNEPLLDKLDALIQASPVRDLFSKGTRAIRDKTVELTPVQVATWIEHMRRALRSHTIRPGAMDEEPRVVTYARLVQEHKAMLTASDEEVAKLIPEWEHAVLALGGVGGSRTLPKTREEFRHYNEGRWEEFRQRRARDLIEGTSAP